MSGTQPLPPLPGFERRSIGEAALAYSRCEYCQKAIIAPPRITADWEHEHRDKCRKPSGVAA